VALEPVGVHDQLYKKAAVERVVLIQNNFGLLGFGRRSLIAAVLNFPCKKSSYFVLTLATAGAPKAEKPGQVFNSRFLTSVRGQISCVPHRTAVPTGCAVWYSQFLIRTE
jgi:hypothetical protein